MQTRRRKDALPRKKLLSKSVGAFHKMCLSKDLLNGIRKLGYRLPTPIQRKCIPILLDGHDIVAMARTGSGKTAAFLIPILQLLGSHQRTVGIRALILSPTRELALQTHQFASKLSKYTDLRIGVFVGGESMEQQFDALSYNPDLIVATPGRLSHLIKETNLSMRAVQHFVFDEADRLFELGFGVQIRSIMNNMTREKQTMLFSATLPRTLADFTRASLRHPIIVRLDTDIKISPHLQLSHFFVRPDEKLGALLFLLQEVIPLTKSTLIFCATRYHVELIVSLLKLQGMNAVPCFGSMEPLYRKLNVSKFRAGEVHIMVVTDLAARGVDIPLLDHVINFHMPTSAKNFVHRVGRVARAGRFGVAWSLIAPDEVAYLVDVCRFLKFDVPGLGDDESDLDENADRVEDKDENGDDEMGDVEAGGDDFWDDLGDVQRVDENEENSDGEDDLMEDFDSDISENDDTDVVVVKQHDAEDSDDETAKTRKKNETLDELVRNDWDTMNYTLDDKVSFGVIPRQKLYPHYEAVEDALRKSHDLKAAFETADKGMRMFKKTCSKPTSYGTGRHKNVDTSRIHPLFNEETTKTDVQAHDMRNAIRSFRPSHTVFEMEGAMDADREMMKEKRIKSILQIVPPSETHDTKKQKKPKKRKRRSSSSSQPPAKRIRLKAPKTFRDPQFYIDEAAKEDSFSEQLLNVADEGNDSSLKKYVLELDGDERHTLNVKKKLHRYNKKTGKFVTEYLGDRVKRYLDIRNDANKIVKSKHNYGRHYAQWKEDSKRSIGRVGAIEHDDPSATEERVNMKALGLRRRRNMKGSIEDKIREAVKAKRRDNWEETKAAEDRKKRRVEKVKKDKFRKWWKANKDRVKKRKRLRRQRPF